MKAVAHIHDVKTMDMLRSVAAEVQDNLKRLEEAELSFDD